jgi:ActR/RegA family two-component response regulator
MTQRAQQRQQQAPWVLVVDDEPLTARATARAVSASTGARVSLVSDVDSALHLVRRASEAPAAVLLDFDLKDGETGLTVLLSLRAAGCESPCAFHTGAPARARAALSAARFDDGYPVFDKGTQGFATWVLGLLRGGASAHSSGVRRKLV